jgi:hypothetical protein
MPKFNPKKIVIQIGSMLYLYHLLRPKKDEHIANVNIDDGRNKFET